MRVLTVIGELATEEDAPELTTLPELCERWERRHHGRLKLELAAIRGLLAFLHESAGHGNSNFLTRGERFRLSVSQHLKWEQQLWRSVHQTPRRERRLGKPWRAQQLVHTRSTPASMKH
jgi:hypothetical protein